MIPTFVGISLILFVILNLAPGRPGADLQPPPTDPDVARALCDRHFGVGADGILAILPGQQGHARMRVINADGSEAEMCGNGLRCFVKYLAERDPGLTGKPALTIDTGFGPLTCAIDRTGGAVESVSVEMGRPRLTRREIPMAGPAQATLEPRPLRAHWALHPLLRPGP